MTRRWTKNLGVTWCHLILRVSLFSNWNEGCEWGWFLRYSTKTGYQRLSKVKQFLVVKNGRRRRNTYCSLQCHVIIDPGVFQIIRFLHRLSLFFDGIHTVKFKCPREIENLMVCGNILLQLCGNLVELYVLLWLQFNSITVQLVLAFGI